MFNFFNFNQHGLSVAVFFFLNLKKALKTLFKINFLEQFIWILIPSVFRVSVADPGGDVVAAPVDTLGPLGPLGTLDTDVLPLERVELFRGYPALLLQAAAACCLLFVIVGVPGNLITIIALNRCKKVSHAMLGQLECAVVVGSIIRTALIAGPLGVLLAWCAN